MHKDVFSDTIVHAFLVDTLMFCFVFPNISILCPQGSGLGTVNGAENTAGTDIYKDFAFVSVLMLNSLTYVDWTTQRQVASLLCVLWDEVVVCIVLGSHQIWEITIQSTVFLMATLYQLDIFICFIGDDLLTRSFFFENYCRYIVLRTLF